MDDEEKLKAKLRAIEALFSGATTAGERDAADSARQRIAARLSDPEIVLVAESGISGVEDVARLERAGAAGFLVGELLMRQPDPGEALETLRRSS